ncbi:FMN-dependent NADH-azoreductase [Spirosoma flavum]|uniref:FMN dependent NADH:quinone oxidoreductase n=1 Tax=Spirosoma flavum TaxID=2048557 RepID=A0ABW6AR99_9BACT
MKKILNIIASPRADESFSSKLGYAIIEQIKEANPGSTVQTRDLNLTPFPHVEVVHLAAFYAPEDSYTPESKAAVQHSNEAIQEIMDADILLISTPMWNFSIPSVLKAWIDHIARAGVTFQYSEKGPVGLIKGKKVYIALASGSFYSAEPAQSLDFAAPYLKTFLGFLGLTDLSLFRVEGTGIPGAGDISLEKAIATIVL